MTEEEAKKILDINQDGITIEGVNEEYAQWWEGDRRICLDGDFTSRELEAVIWWMNNKGKKED